MMEPIQHVWQERRESLNFLDAEKKTRILIMLDGSRKWGTRKRVFQGDVKNK